MDLWESLINEYGKYEMENICDYKNMTTFKVKRKQGFYFGTFKNGLMEGQGCFINKEQQSIYEGEMKNDMADGKGRIIFKDSYVYIGDWKNDKF